jgi:ubiquinone/menaquinone biosynthesis C-methylase UbiE
MEADHRPIYPMMATELDLQPDDDLLDVGCGAAGLLASQATHVRYVAGLDASGIQVSLARRRLAERIDEGTAEIVLGDATTLPWEDGRFSVVTAYGCLEFVPDPLRALSEMYRVLRPGGRAVLTLGLATDDASTSGTKNRWGFTAWTAADGRRLLEEAGFADVSISPPPTRYFTLQLARGTKPASVPVPGPVPAGDSVSPA